MRVRLLPYKMSSESAKNISRDLGIKRIYPQGSKFKCRSSDLIINWGCSSTDNQSITPSTKTLNKFSAINIASNKLSSLKAFAENSVSHPEYTESKEAAQIWIEEGNLVYCRKTLTGKGGNGIVVASTIEELVDAPLYTKGINAGIEYRVHVFKGMVIDFIKKGRRIVDEDEDRPSPLIRNYERGWVFIRGGIELPIKVQLEAIQAVNALGLDFGAVDIAQIKNSTDVVVYEVNTAPGLQGTTLEYYKKAILNYIRS